jgi:cyanophycin synthetase
MAIRRLLCLRGPNVWAAANVFEAVLDLRDGPSLSAEQIRATIARLQTVFLDSMVNTDENRDNLLFDLAGSFATAVRTLQTLAGNPVSFTTVRPTMTSGLFLIAIEFLEEPVGRAAVEIAWRLLQTAREGNRVSLEEHLGPLRELAYAQRLPASTAVICRAARARGIPVARLSPEYGRYLILGHGAKQHRCQASETDSISSVARSASTDKYLTKQLLQMAGVPVPRGRLVSTIKEAWDTACLLGLPVAVKPQDSDLATGVSLDLRTREQVEEGFRHANEHSSWVLIERFAPGMEHRVLVVADRVVAVTRIEPPHVVGDGVSTVAELVERVNRDPRRGDEGSGAPLSKLKIDKVAETVLAAQGFTLASVPPTGGQVLVRRNPPYFKNGGNLVDLTDHIHPSTAAHAVAAAQALQLRVAGLDIVALDISKPLEQQGGVVVEINAGPGLWLHMAPWADSPRPVGEAIVESLFPAGDDGRIPVAAVVGDSTGSITRELTAMLSFAGVRAGSAGETGVILGGRHWLPVAETPLERAAALLRNPSVDVALLGTTPCELVRAGFTNDRCDVAILLDPRTDEDDAIGPPLTDFMQVLRHALTPAGVVVLPVMGDSIPIETGLPAARVVLVACQADLSKIQDHLAAGGRAFLAHGDAITLAQGREESRFLGNRPRNMTVQEAVRFLAALAAFFVLRHGDEYTIKYLCFMS